MLDFDVLDCPICCEPFTIPIFQCDNGHLACSSCCPKLSNKCPACTLPVGHSRCRAMESVLASVFVSCRNAKFGCTKKVCYGKESAHEKECIFSQCSCPELDCNYTGSYKDLYEHYGTHHISIMTTKRFQCGISIFMSHVLYCPICFEALTIQIFQCNHGHLACSSCCLKLNKCPTSASPVGNNRCRAMESVLASVFVSCRNAKFGCTKNVSYGKVSTHEKECTFAQCSCPMNIESDKILLLSESKKRLLFAVQCFYEPLGVYVTVRCIAPSTSKVGKLAYCLYYSMDGHTLT
ncbi:unnamed protein product [Arabidopsis thaliana]|uniref:RING-type E3 ubiquitin transferase n=1 Tax=Arabidopsis thaliana TaxID=3702 RepID=A0A7G2FFW5_ARATH|nr:unnamed protein product [Arabidopsis thaliana]